MTISLLGGRYLELVLLGAALTLVPSVATAQPSDLGNAERAQFRQCLRRTSCEGVLKAAYSLAMAGDVSFLIRQYGHASRTRRDLIIEGIYSADQGREDPRLTRLMKSRAFKAAHFADWSRGRWCALQFLRSGCDRQALSVLVAGGSSETDTFRFEVPSYQWAESLDAFGRCRYLPATKVLVNSLDNANLDVDNTALDSLQIMYPSVCRDLEGAELVACYMNWGGDTSSD